ncbi:hypothetical protein RN629_07535 [Sphingomonadaceae bacterium jetA1]|jgi:membrane-associated protease RseP (regulator of RpoE activity)|uniref:hypothetical protein n=1 Tax=Facivitalis istanbulensis TaxID=3075838 RepID=UPI003478B3F5
MDDARSDPPGPVTPRDRRHRPVKGLRLVGWSAGAVALVGGLAAALLMGPMSLHPATRTAATLYGATFAPLGDDRTGLVVTSLRSDVDGQASPMVQPPLRVGDTVLTIDDRPATSFTLLREEAARHASTPVRLRVAREHGLVTITLLRTGSGGLRGQQDLIDRR